MAHDSTRKSIIKNSIRIQAGSKITMVITSLGFPSRCVINSHTAYRRSSRRTSRHLHSTGVGKVFGFLQRLRSRTSVPIHETLFFIFRPLGWAANRIILAWGTWAPWQCLITSGQADMAIFIPFLFHFCLVFTHMEVPVAAIHVR